MNGLAIHWRSDLQRIDAAFMVAREPLPCAAAVTWRRSETTQRNADSTSIQGEPPNAGMPPPEAENSSKIDVIVDQAPVAVTSKSPWSATLPEQMALLARLLNETPSSGAAIAAQVTGKDSWKKRLPDLLQTLVALGRARQEGETWRAS